MSDCQACSAIDSAVVIDMYGDLQPVERILRMSGIYGAQCPSCAERELAESESEEEAA